MSSGTSVTVPDVTAAHVLSCPKSPPAQPPPGVEAPATGVDDPPPPGVEAPAFGVDDPATLRSPSSSDTRRQVDMMREGAQGEGARAGQRKAGEPEILLHSMLHRRSAALLQNCLDAPPPLGCTAACTDLLLLLLGVLLLLLPYYSCYACCYIIGGAKRGRRPG